MLRTKVNPAVNEMNNKLRKLRKLQPQINIINEAVAAADAAAREHIRKNPGVWYPCGFAWVKINPARGPLVTALKALGVGRVNKFEGGYDVWNPSNNSTQWLDAKEVGARAFAEVLRKYGFECTVCTRLD